VFVEECPTYLHIYFLEEDILNLLNAGVGLFMSGCFLCCLLEEILEPGERLLVHMVDLGQLCDAEE